MAKAVDIDFGRKYLAEVRRLDRRWHHAIEEFIAAKMTGTALGKRDKATGQRPDGTVVPELRARCVRHYKLHAREADPLLIYQELEGGRRIVLIAIKRHDEIFHGREREFLDRYEGDLVPPGTSSR